MRCIATFYSTLLAIVVFAHSATLSAEVTQPSQVSLPLFFDVDASLQSPLSSKLKNRLIPSKINIKVPYFALDNEVEAAFVEDPSTPLDIARHAMKAIVVGDYNEFQSVCEKSLNWGVSMAVMHEDLSKRLSSQESIMKISGYFELEQGRVYRCHEQNTGVIAAVTLVQREGEWKVKAIMEPITTDGLMIAVEYALERQTVILDDNNTLDIGLSDSQGRPEAIISLNAGRIDQNPVLVSNSKVSPAVPTTESTAVNEVLRFARECLNLLSEIPVSSDYKTSAAYSGFTSRLTPASREYLAEQFLDVEDEELVPMLSYLQLRYSGVYPWCVVVSEPFYFVFYSNKNIANEHNGIDKDKLRNASHSDFLTVLKGENEFALAEFDVRWKEVPFRMPELIFCTERFKSALKEAILDGGTD